MKADWTSRSFAAGSRALDEVLLHVWSFLEKMHHWSLWSTIHIKDCSLGCKIYVGNLPIDVRVHEIEDLFYKYGHIVQVALKTPPRTRGYCFIVFESPLDAEDAIKGRDGYDFDGCHLKVEPAREGRRFSSSVGRSSRDGGGAKKYGVSHRSEYRVVVSGLPSSASWKDLKDYMRKAGDVCFAQVIQNVDGAIGIVHYTNYDDMKYAVRKLNGTEFRNPFSKSYIQVKIYEGNMSRSANRSTNPRRSRSRSRSRRSVACFPNAASHYLQEYGA